MTIARRAFISYMPGAILFLKNTLLQRERAGSAAPDFQLPDLDVRIVRLSEFKGNVVVLDFWATWCAPCVAEIPNLNVLQQTYADRGVHVLGILVESGPVKDIRQFVSKHSVQYRLLIGNDSIVNRYKVFGFLTTFLIDPQGRIHKKYVGVRSGKEAVSAGTLRRDVQAMLDASRKEE